MKQKLVLAEAVSCLMILTFLISCVQIAQPVWIQNEKIAMSRNTQSTSPNSAQLPESNVEQASASEGLVNSNKVDDPIKTADDQTFNENESTSVLTGTNRVEIPDLPAPSPDGRIFLPHGYLLGGDDAIPYLPTENSAAANRTLTLPPELEN